MIVTKDFVLLNNPKTGSTYARQVVKMVYGQTKNPIQSIAQKIGLLNLPYQEIKLKNLQFPNRPKNQHGAYSQIPERFLDRKIVSVIRNPYDKFISAFEYKYWLKQPPEQSTLLALSIEDLSNISIDQFALIQVASIKKRFPHLETLKIGSQTLQFIFMYFKNPWLVVKSLTNEYFLEGKYKHDLGEITFINQNTLSDGLFTFLEQFDLDKAKLEQGRQMGRVNANKKRPSLESYEWSLDALLYVETYEKFLFLMLKELGFNFERPEAQKKAINNKIEK